MSIFDDERRTRNLQPGSDRRFAGAPLPAPRGPVSAWVLRRLQGRPTLAVAPPSAGPALDDADLHLALHCLHDLAYRSFAGVDPAGERDPLLVGLRWRLEGELLAAIDVALHERDHDRWTARARQRGAGEAVDGLLASFAGPSLSRFMERDGTRAHFVEFMVHRSAYQLKEADPHTVGLARLPGGPRKSAYAQIQFDEYGNGEPGTTHAELFAAAMRDAGLRDDYGHYVDELPAATLATGNLLSLFASRRELLGALVGHLALFEMTSVAPMGRYARAAARLGLGPAVQRFYDVHVEADTIHGALARTHLLGDRTDGDGLDPASLLYGAHALLHLEDRFAQNLLDHWHEGTTALVPRPTD